MQHFPPEILAIVANHIPGAAGVIAGVCRELSDKLSPRISLNYIFHRANLIKYYQSSLGAIILEDTRGNTDSRIRWMLFHFRYDKEYEKKLLEAALANYSGEYIWAIDAYRDNNGITTPLNYEYIIPRFVEDARGIFTLYYLAELVNNAKPDLDYVKLMRKVIGFRERHVVERFINGFLEELNVAQFNDVDEIMNRIIQDCIDDDDADTFSWIFEEIDKFLPCVDYESLLYLAAGNHPSEVLSYMINDAKWIDDDHISAECYLWCKDEILRVSDDDERYYNIHYSFV